MKTFLNLFGILGLIFTLVHWNITHERPHDWFIVIVFIALIVAWIKDLLDEWGE